MEKLEIQSPAFATGAPIPKEFTQQGSDMSPPLDITNIPKGTQSLVLVCVDPDAPDPEAPKLTFVHWVAYNLPAQQLSIPEGVNGRGTVGYIGPKPPIGTHRYFFKVFAVDTVLSFNEPPELKDVFNAIDGRVVQMAETMGTYKLQF